MTTSLTQSLVPPLQHLQASAALSQVKYVEGFDMDWAIQAPVQPFIVISSNSVAATYSVFNVQSVWWYLLHLSSLSHGLQPSPQNTAFLDLFPTCHTLAILIPSRLAYCVTGIQIFLHSLSLGM